MISPKSLFGKTKEGKGRLRLFLTGAAFVFVLYQFVLSLTRPRGDFLLHHEFGRRLLAGEFLYRGGMHIPYPPFWAVLNAPLSLLPTGVAKALFLLIGVGALAAILRMLQALSAETMPLKHDRLPKATLGALACTAPFIIRDFDDGGQNLFLLSLSLGGIYWWTRNRTALAGASLGAAIALKCTPLLLLLYFAWKREWKMTGVTLALALAFALSPIMWQGPASYVRHMQAWGTCLRQSLAERDPSIGILGPEKLQNRSLRPALARYLTVLPAGHPGRIESRGYLDLGHLPPARASQVIRVLMLFLLAAIAWRFRAPARSSPGQHPQQGTIPGPQEAMSVVWEGATVLLLMLLYSPITWGQHCVAALPLIYLLIRSYLTEREVPHKRVAAFGIVMALILGTDRLFWGRPLALLWESYHVVTVALLALLLLGLWHISALKRAETT